MNALGKIVLIGVGLIGGSLMLDLKRRRQVGTVVGIDINADYEKKVNALTIESVRDFANQLLSQGNRIEVSMSSK